MRGFVLAGLAAAALLISGPAQAFDRFIPMGLGYSSANIGLSQLSESDRRIISQTDIYETDIYERQLRARQMDTRMQHFMNDRNFDGTDTGINY